MTTETEYAQRRWQALALLCVAQFMVILDASIVNVALPTIGEALQFSQDDLSWVINAYVLTFGGFLLLGGRLADLLGRRRIFIGGLIVFAIASLAGGFAQNDIQLVIARAVQGLGAALVSPAALSIITVTFKEGAERNKALGAWGAVAGSGGAVGVLLGGVLTDGLGWEWVLWVNVPIGLITAFVAIEQRTREPLVPFRIFRLPTLTGANAVGLLLGASLFSMFFFASLYMQQVLGYSAIKAGLSYVPLSFGIIVSAAVGSQIATKVGFKPVLVTGLACVTVALVWWSRVSADGDFLTDILGPSFLAAIGLGLSFVTVTIAAVAGVQDRESGLASGLINTSQQVGGALGLAILATVANSISDDKLAVAASPFDQAVALTDGFKEAFLVGAGFAALALILALTLIKSSDSRAMIDSEATAEASP